VQSRTSDTPCWTRSPLERFRAESGQRFPVAAVVWLPGAEHNRSLDPGCASDKTCEDARQEAREVKVNGSNMLAKVAIAGMFLGAAGAASLQAAQADADDPLSGSDTAIILGGTFEPT